MKKKRKMRSLPHRGGYEVMSLGWIMGIFPDFRPRHIRMNKQQKATDALWWEHWSVIMVVSELENFEKPV